MLPRDIPINSLKVFESAGRLLSFTAAAAECGVTQGAVSQRIKDLEVRLGVTLFLRLGRALALTFEGERLVTAVRGGFKLISAGLAELDKTASGRPLRFTLMSSLATRWLLPRLIRLTDIKSGGPLVVIADDRLLDLAEEADVALRFGMGRYPGCISKPLSQDALFPVCSPDFLARHPMASHIGESDSAAKWQDLPLIADTVAENDHSGCGWNDWLGPQGIQTSLPAAAVGFSHAHLSLQAAAEGLGIALARHILVADDLKSGRLVRLGTLARPVAPRFSYHLVCAPEVEARIRLLASWLKREIGISLKGPSQPTIVPNLVRA